MLWTGAALTPQWRAQSPRLLPRTSLTSCESRLSSGLRTKQLWAGGSHSRLLRFINLLAQLTEVRKAGQLSQYWSVVKGTAPGRDAQLGTWEGEGRPCLLRLSLRLHPSNALHAASLSCSWKLNYTGMLTNH